jgi:uroporphyrinogen-III synthase
VILNIKFNNITFVLREKRDAEINSKYLNDNGVYAKPFPITTTKYNDVYKSYLLNHNFDYFIITSANALQPLEKIILNSKKFTKKNIKVFAIGEETKVKLNQKGYENVLSANNNSMSLYQLIISNTLDIDLGLWVAAKNRSSNLEERLIVKNRKIEIFEAYETQPIIKISRSIQNDLVNYKKINLLIFSSRNVSITKDILQNLNLFSEVNNKSTLLVNSENVANNGKSIGWNNVVNINKNFTKDILDYILQLSR